MSQMDNKITQMEDKIDNKMSRMDNKIDTIYTFLPNKGMFIFDSQTQTF